MIALPTCTRPVPFLPATAIAVLDERRVAFRTFIEASDFAGWLVLSTDPRPPENLFEILVENRP